MTLDVLMTAWPRTPARLGYFRQSLRGLEKLRGDIELQIYLSLETQAGVEPVGIREYCASHGITVLEHNAAPSLTGSLAILFAASTASCILYVQDDFDTVRPPPLAADLAFLESRPDVGMIGYNRPGLRVIGKAPAEPPLWEILIDRKWFFFSHWPNLARRAYWDVLGPLPNPEPLGRDGSERIYDQRARKLWPRWRIFGRGSEGSYFRHIGNETTLVEKYGQAHVWDNATFRPAARARRGR